MTEIPIIVNTNEVTVGGVVDQVELQLSVGAQGERGSRIFSGDVSPLALPIDSPYFAGYTEFIPGDVYIERSVTVLALWEWKSQPGGYTWVQTATISTGEGGSGLLDADLEAIAALTGTNGLLRKTAINTWVLDTNSYLTSNQSITLSGDVTGTGTSSITTTVADDSHSHTSSTISALDAGDTTTGTFNIARIPTGTTGTTVALGNHTHSGYQAADNDLTAIAAISGTGYLRRTGVDTWTLDTPATATWGGITGTLSSQTDLQNALNAKQTADNDLTAIAALAGTSGFLKKTATDTWALDTSTYLTDVVTTLNNLVNIDNSTTTHTAQFAYGATTSGQTKTVNIGGSGVSGSQTNINIGSGAGGNSSTIFRGDLKRVFTNININAAAPNLDPSFLGSTLAWFPKTRFMAATYERSVDGSTGWTTATFPMGIVDGRGASAVSLDGTNYIGHRFTWTGLIYSYIQLTRVGINWSSPSIKYDLIVETSTDGTTWYEIARVTGAGIQQTNLLPHRTVDNQVRVSIILTSNFGNIPVNGIDLLTARVGDQGAGEEYWYPFTWDSSRNFTMTGTVAASGLAGSLLSTTNPLMNGSVSYGSSVIPSRQDHVHPVDTSRSPVASPTFTGTPAAPTAAVDTNTTQIATTAYVVGQGYLKSSTASSTYQPLDGDLTAIAALAGTSGLLKKTAANTWTLDTTAYTTNTGTVTSVAMTVPTGLSISGTPVTASGTLALTLTSGYSIPTTASQSNWDTAYTDRNKWDGGSSGLTASTGRTSLGATTVGSNLFTLTNPTAITFLRVNADNTISTLDAATFRTAIGAGTSSTTGTVTSVGMSVPTGLSISGTPVTTSGTLAVTLTAGYEIPTTAALAAKAPLASPTFTGKVTTAATAVGGAGFSLPHGTAPSSPANGDVWSTTAGVYARVNGVTIGPFAAASGGATWGSITGTLSSQSDLNTALNGKAAANQTMYIGTQAIAINAGSGTITSLAGVTSMGSLATVGTITSGTWSATAIANDKIASALTGKTYNALTLTAAATGFTIAGGTTSKTLTVSNTLTLSGTDSSTLNIGSGGTLGTAAYTASSAYAPSTLSTSAQTASYTAVLSDSGKIVEIANASANTFTIPPNSSVAFSVGTQITVVQTDTGQTTITAGSGVTINATPGLKLRDRWSSATIIKRATDTWLAVGDLSA